MSSKIHRLCPLGFDDWMMTGFALVDLDVWVMSGFAVGFNVGRF